MNEEFIYEKKLIVALVMLAISLCSCSNGKTNGIVDCYEIKVTNGESVVFTGEYSTSFTCVFEYKIAADDSQSLAANSR